MPDLTKEQLYIILGIIAIVLIGCVLGIYNQNAGIKQSSPESSLQTVIIGKPVKTEQNEPVYVHISGAVLKEGVYRLNKGDRLVDLLGLAGVDPYGDLDSVNLAETLTDGQKVFIPKKAGNVSSDPIIDANIIAEKKGSIININNADEKQLDSLPGIGATMAKRIVEHRKDKGRFSNIEELREVQGISQKKFDKLKKQITVN